MKLWVLIENKGFDGQNVIGVFDTVEIAEENRIKFEIMFDGYPSFFIEEVQLNQISKYFKNS